MWTHKTAILLTLAAFVLFLATPGLAYADEGTGEMDMVVNGYHVRLVLPGPAKTGENPFHVQISGADGSPVSGAAVQAAAQPVEEMTASPTPTDSMAGMNMDEPAAQP
jgi:hypothetical protein